WLHATLAAAPQTGTAVPTGIRAPDAPPAFLDALDAKFATATGKAQAAYLVSAQFDGGRSGQLVAIIGARADAEPDLARDVAEAAQFAGFSQPVDVAFLDETDPRVERFARHGLRFDLPEPEKMQPLVSPGMDPAAPPRLK
ncbi:MAG: SseB family protein, partial [Pseudomonadota bacterium]